MKNVANLLILGICGGTNKAEIYKGMEALTQRFAGKKKRLFVVYVIQNPNSISPTVGVDSLYIEGASELGDHTSECIHLRLDVAPDHDDRTVGPGEKNGVYLVSHGTAGKFIVDNSFFRAKSRNPAGMATLVDKVLCAFGMEEVEKLSVVSCVGALGPDSPVEELADELFARGQVKPKVISGWPCLVFLRKNGTKKIVVDGAKIYDSSAKRANKVHLDLTPRGYRRRGEGGLGEDELAVELDDDPTRATLPPERPSSTRRFEEDARLLADAPREDGCCPGCTLF